MNLSLLSILMYWLMPTSDVPNFYPTFTSARDAAITSQKEMLIFFSDRNCSMCEPAWNAFEKDPKATQLYISTRLNADDFDGGVILEMYESTEVPCWIILTLDGNIKEKWTGGWKDASGNPTLFVGGETKTKISKPEGTTSYVAKSSPIVPSSSPAPVVSTSTPNTTAVSTNKETKPSSAPPPAAVSKPENTSNRFVVQAGYFGSEANAKKLVSDLTGKGFDGFSIKTTQQNGSTFYRVISKSFSTEMDADKEVQSLLTAGVKAAVKKAAEI